MVVPHLSFFWLDHKFGGTIQGDGSRGDVASNVSTAFVCRPSHSNCVCCASFIKDGEESVRPAGPWSNLWLGGTAEAVPSHEFFNSDRGPESGCRFTCA